MSEGYENCCDNTQSKMLLNCDQVCWIMNSLERYAELCDKVPVRSSKFKKSLKVASLLDIMEIINADFEDTRASGNALSEFTEFNELRGMSNEKKRFDG